MLSLGLLAYEMLYPVLVCFNDLIDECVNCYDVRLFDSNNLYANSVGPKSGSFHS
jgi:hypothetical protein